MLRIFRVFFAASTMTLMALGGSPLLAHEGQDDDDYAAGEPGDAPKPSRTVEVTMNESDGAMSYTPTEVDVKKDEQIKFVIKNNGTLKHEFHLDTVADNTSHRREMEKNPEMVHDDPNAQTVEPGKETEILWKFSKPGVFEFACLIPGHYQAGMHGKAAVK